jgi:hypothetical protein
MSSRVAVVRTDVSEEHITPFITENRIDELETSAVTKERSTLQRNTT